MSKDHPSKKRRRRDRKRFQKRKLAIIAKIISEIEEDIAMWVVAGCPSLLEEYRVGMLQRNLELLKLELQHIKPN